MLTKGNGFRVGGQEGNGVFGSPWEDGLLGVGETALNTEGTGVHGVRLSVRLCDFVLGLR